MNSKICFVVQRYGMEINGGAELLCRQLAEKMLYYYPDIEVLTTKAIDYMTWKNEYQLDEENINGVQVHRFAVEHERNLSEFNQINARFMQGLLEESEEMEWLEKQGPYVPHLIDYLVEHQYEYKVIVFFGYLYYPSVMGIHKIKQKAITIPFAHDEPFLKMKIFCPIFLKPNAIFFQTDEERDLVNTKYDNTYIPSQIGGAGVDIPSEINEVAFSQKYNVSNYIIYVGRIDEGKNCKELFDYFIEYKKRNKNDLKLVLLGKAVIPIPRNSDIKSLGFVSDEDKFNGIAGAKALVLPSKLESLSIVVLEAMALGTPVIVNGTCPVLKGHCIKSNGAFYYNNYFEFEGELRYLEEHPDVVRCMTQNAKKYISENYQWDKITEKLFRLIEQVSCNNEEGN